MKHSQTDGTEYRENERIISPKFSWIINEFLEQFIALISWPILFRLNERTLKEKLFQNLHSS